MRIYRRRNFSAYTKPSQSIISCCSWGEYRWVDFATNAGGFWLGGAIWLAGTVLILVLRLTAIRNEFTGFFRIVVGMLADKPTEMREKMMTQMLGTIAEQSEQSRKAILGAMVRGIKHLPPEKQEPINTSRRQAIQNFPIEKRKSLKQIMQRFER